MNTTHAVAPRASRRLLSVCAETTLSNGLRVLAVHHPAVPLVEIRLRLSFPAVGLRGAAAKVLADRLLYGYKGPEFERQHHRLTAHGGELFSTSDPQGVTLGGTVLAPHLGVLLTSLFHRLVRERPVARDLAGERARAARQAAALAMQPEVVAREVLLRMLGVDAQCLPEIPTDAEIRAITEEQVARVREDFVRPEGAILVMVGDLPPEEMLKRLAGSPAAGWEVPGKAPGITRTAITVPTEVRRLVRLGQTQATLLLCGGTVARDSAKFPSVFLAGSIFGGSFSSRLATRLRDRLGLAYTVSSGFDFTQGRGLVTVHTRVKAEAYERALSEIRAEADRMRTDLPSSTEITRARRYVTGSLWIAAATPGGLASMLLPLRDLGLPFTHLDDLFGEISAVSKEDVREAAGAFLAGGVLGGVAVLPP